VRFGSVSSNSLGHVQIVFKGTVDNCTALHYRHLCACQANPERSLRKDRSNEIDTFLEINLIKTPNYMEWSPCRNVSSS
jgi:hypothetical protein